MSKFKDFIAALGPDKMQALTDLLDEHLTDLEQKDPQDYWDIIHDIYILAHGPYFDEESAKYAVSCMINSDGTVGEHWPVVETTAVAIQNGVSFDSFTEYDWYYVLNMIYSDYSSVLVNAPATSIALAKAWITDIDAPVGKAYKYWKMLKS